MKHRFLIISVFFTFIFSDTFSQHDTLKIKPVYINSDFLSENQNVTQIDSIFLANNFNNQLSDLIKINSGIFVKSFGLNGVSTVSIRGTSANHTKVLWNNVPLNSSMNGQSDFSIIPVFFSDKINIFSGIYSLTQNSGAIGGIIDLKTNTEFEKPISFSLAQNFGSFGNLGTFLKLKKSNKKISYNFRAYYKKSKNNFRFVNTSLPDFVVQINENSEFVQYGVLSKIDLKINKSNLLSLRVFGTYTDRNISPIMSYSGLYRQENQIDIKKSITLDYAFNKNFFKINFTSACLSNNLNYFLADSVMSYPLNYQIIKNNSENSEKIFYNVFNVDFQKFKNVSFNTKITSSYQIANSVDSSTYNSLGYSAKRFENNINLLVNYYVFKQLKAYFNVNETVINNEIFSPAFNLGLISEIIDQNKLVLGLNAGKNINFPTLNDLYWCPGGNTDLKPEKSKQIDFFVKNSIEKNKFYSDIKLVIYASEIKDWILWKPSEFGYWTAQNIRNVFSRGLEINYIFSHNGLIDKQININYALNFVSEINSKSTFSLFEGNQLIYSPKNTLNFNFSNSFKTYDFTINYSYTSKQFTNTSNNTFSLPAFSLLNFVFSKHFVIKKYNLLALFYLNNIFDKSYQAVLYRPMPGRNFELKISITF